MRFIRIIAAAILCLISFDVAGAAMVQSKSGVRVSVAPDMQRAFQCVIDHVEAAGVKIASMRGYGKATRQGSRHPEGRGLDINQYDRDKTRPNVPRHVANAAADKCGVVSGTRWRDADNGHWNAHGRRQRGARRHHIRHRAYRVGYMPKTFDRQQVR